MITGGFLGLDRLSSGTLAQITQSSTPCTLPLLVTTVSLTTDRDRSSLALQGLSRQAGQRNATSTYCQLDSTQAFPTGRCYLSSIELLRRSNKHKTSRTLLTNTSLLRYPLAEHSSQFLLLVEAQDYLGMLWWSVDHCEPKRMLFPGKYRVTPDWNCGPREAGFRIGTPGNMDLRHRRGRNHNSPLPIPSAAMVLRSCSNSTHWGFAC